MKEFTIFVHLFVTIPFKQLTIPANSYVLDKDHDYAQECRVTKFLKAVHLLDVNKYNVENM